MAKKNKMTVEEAGRKGGQRTSQTHGEEFYSEIGSKGGQAVQQSGNAHELTNEERAEGGKNSRSGSRSDNNNE